MLVGALRQVGGAGEHATRTGLDPHRAARHLGFQPDGVLTTRVELPTKIRAATK